MVWLQAERVGPDWDALRHAELVAAAHNGALQKKDKSLFTVADFVPADPWAPPRPKLLNPQDEALNQLFGGAAHE